MISFLIDSLICSLVHDPCLNVVCAALLFVSIEDFSYTGSLSFLFFFFYCNDFIDI